MDSRKAVADRGRARSQYGRLGIFRSLERVIRRLALLLTLGLAAAAAFPAHAKTWIRAESPHFVIYSDIGESKTRDYLEQLEAFKYLADLMLGADPSSQAAGAPFTIYLMSEQEALRIVRPDFDRYVAGVYLHCVEGSIAFSSRPVNWNPSQPDRGLITLLHEYAHHLMFSRMQRWYPRWYVEGFADYMSTTTLRRGSYQVGGAHQGRTYFLTDEARWLDFAVILDPIKFRQAAEEGEVGALQFYAQSWLLAHYMLSDSERTREFNAYFDRVGRGENAIESFESETGLSVATLRKELQRYLRRLPGLRVTVPNLPEAAIKTTRLPASREDYVLQAAVLQTCPGDDLGEKLTEHLRKARKRHASDDHLRMELARAELLFGDAKLARTELEALAQANDQDPELLYLLGRSYLDADAGEGEDRDALRKKAAEKFLASYKLRKLHPPTLYHLSVALDDGPEPSRSAINAANGAAVLAPSVFKYAFHATMINLRAGNRDMAVRVIQPFASDPHNASLAASVTAMIEAIRQDKSIEDVVRAMDRLSSDAPDSDESDSEADGSDSNTDESDSE